jgi:hypothetical protein
MVLRAWKITLWGRRFRENLGGNIHNYLIPVSHGPRNKKREKMIVK